MSQITHVCSSVPLQPNCINVPLTISEVSPLLALALATCRTYSIQTEDNPYLGNTPPTQTPDDLALVPKNTIWKLTHNPHTQIEGRETCVSNNLCTTNLQTRTIGHRLD